MIVDVLSFCTAVDVAVGRGTIVRPFPLADHAAASAEARRFGATLALPRRAAGGQFSLSPASLVNATAGLHLMLPSPNGSRLSMACGPTPVIAGCLRNAAAVADRARHLANGGPIGVIAAGERWPDGSLRPAIEDWLGAGAILHHLAAAMSPEADLAHASYLGVRSRLSALVRACRSGQELILAGFAADVDLAVAEDVSATAPTLAAGCFRAG